VRSNVKKSAAASCFQASLSPVTTRGLPRDYQAPDMSDFVSFCFSPQFFLCSLSLWPDLNAARLFDSFVSKREDLSGDAAGDDGLTLGDSLSFLGHRYVSVGTSHYSRGLHRHRRVPLSSCPWLLLDRVGARFGGSASLLLGYWLGGN